MTWRCVHCTLVNPPPSGPRLTAVLEATAAVTGVSALSPAATALIVNAFDANCAQCQRPRVTAKPEAAALATATTGVISKASASNSVDASEAKQPEEKATSKRRRRRCGTHTATHWACGSCLYANEYATAASAASAASASAAVVSVVSTPSKDVSSGGSGSANSVAQSPPPLSCAVCGAIKRIETKTLGYGCVSLER